MKRAKTLILLSLCGLLLFLAGGADAGFKSYFEGDADTKKIAVTVDDGYGLDHLESILDLCQTYQIHITFFPLGTVIKPENAALWQRIVDEGHEIGNHTYGHPNILKITEYELERQLIRMQEALNAVLREPYPLRLFRPPYGKYNRTTNGTMGALVKLGYPYVILWSVDITDAEKALKATRGGSILLFHTNKADVTCLKTLIPMLLDAGYEPVTISELLDLPPAESGADDGE
jgi:peptidoglycan-N-acetylglucosamine deacetylase